MKTIGREVHVAIVGLGARGRFSAFAVAAIENVHVDIVCDLYEDRVREVADVILDRHGYRPIVTQNFDDILKVDSVEAVFIFTSWEAHIPLAIKAMKAGQWVALEVGGAYSVQQCWDLVHTSEETGMPCMLLENCCYCQRELTVANMARHGLFGKIVHCEGGYRHDLRRSVAAGVENRHYRLRNYLNVNSHNYPTHDFGPIAKIIGINRGNRPLSLYSMASGSFGVEDFVARYRPDDENLRGRDFNLGDVVTTLIKCAGGESVTLTLDTSLPRFYSRNFTVQGTRGMYEENSNSIYLDDAGMDHQEMITQHQNNMRDYPEYITPLWRPENAENVTGGHGGIDNFCFRDFLDCLARGDKNVPIDVYDTATWMCITALSAESLATGQAVAFPDFTNGAWIQREPIDCDDFTQPIVKKEEKPEGENE